MSANATPFRIEFSFRTPLIVPGTVRLLDGVLSWARVQKAEFEGEEDPFSLQHDLPLEKHETASGWCFKCSRIEFDWAGDLQYLHYIKRSSVHEYSRAWEKGLLKKAPAFDGARGSTKAASLVLPLRWATAARAWGIGDIEALKTLLPWTTHISKLHHNDFGAVREFVLHEDLGAIEKWRCRPLPIGSEFVTPQHAVAMGGLRSPYWMRSQHNEILAFAG